MTTPTPPYPPGTRIRGLVYDDKRGTCLWPGVVESCEWADDRQGYRVTARMVPGAPDEVTKQYSCDSSGQADYFHPDTYPDSTLAKGIQA